MAIDYFFLPESNLNHNLCVFEEVLIIIDETNKMSGHHHSCYCCIINQNKPQNRSKELPSGGIVWNKKIHNFQ